MTRSAELDLAIRLTDTIHAYCAEHGIQIPSAEGAELTKHAIALLVAGVAKIDGRARRRCNAPVMETVGS